MNATKISEVEANKNLLSIGDVIVYSDSENFQKWTITNLLEDCMEIQDEHETDYKFFDELQKGWEILKAKNKSQMILN
jgi:hypothetical protein